MKLITFMLGLVIGSFLNLCIHRIPLGISVITPPSHCPKCNYRLGVVDLVPVISFLLLRGKCRRCSAKISVRYPLVELCCGAAFLGFFLYFGLSLEYAAALVLFSGLLVSSLIDIEHRIIPNGVNLAMAVPAVPLLLLQSAELLLMGLFGALVGGGLLLLAAVLSKGGMGGGDIKLAAVLGLYLGWPHILLVLFGACLMCSTVGITLVLLKKKTLKDILPFGPYLSIAALTVLLWGDEIVSWYVSTLLKGGI